MHIDCMKACFCTQCTHAEACLPHELAACALPQARAAGATDAVSWLFVPPPQPIKFPRRALDSRFAVLLMRSSYEAVDDLDYIPMDRFQKLFWRFRASEQEVSVMLA